MQLIPVRESDYEPSIYDPETGLVQGQDYVTPNSLTLFQTESGDYMFPEDVHIYFRENQDNDDDVKSLTFSVFMDRIIHRSHHHLLIRQTGLI